METYQDILNCMRREIKSFTYASPKESIELHVQSIELYMKILTSLFPENIHAKFVSRMSSTLFANCIVEVMNLVPPSLNLN